jgi:hypothetical protein
MVHHSIRLNLANGFETSLNDGYMRESVSEHLPELEQGIYPDVYSPCVRPLSYYNN